MRPPSAWSRTRFLPVLALASALAVTAVPGAAVAKAKAPVIRGDFFGTHHLGLDQPGARGWPQAPVGSVRIWDNGVAWNQVEKAPGVFDWAATDALVAKARANRASILLVLGQTPAFHSTRPTAPGAYGPGASAMPTKAGWTAYVRAVALRNKAVWGGAVTLQVWNEANALPYWSGTPAQMALLTAWAKGTLRSAHSSTKLVAPAMVTRLSSQQSWIKAFYGQKVAGKPVASYVDAVSFQLYPVASGTPEMSMSLLAGVRKTLARYKVRKPIYNTEVNYGLIGGPQAGAAAAPITSERQAAYVSRTYLLNASYGVGRVYWYRWDSRGMVNTVMVNADDTTLTPAGQAFSVTRSWILGTRPAGCSHARNATYVCTFTVGKQLRRVVWNPARSVKVVTPKKTSSYVTLDGVAHSTRRGKKVTIGTSPVLFRGSR